jgi:hypothetical protein
VILHDPLLANLFPPQEARCPYNLIKEIPEKQRCSSGSTGKAHSLQQSDFVHAGAMLPLIHHTTRRKGVVKCGTQNLT